MPNSEATYPIKIPARASGAPFLLEVTIALGAAVASAGSVGPLDCDTITCLALTSPQPPLPIQTEWLTVD